MADTAAAGPTSATFFFDPGCPWTWMSSRWLVAAAQERDLDVRWRTFSLGLLDKDRAVPPFLDTPEMRSKMGLSARALLVVQSLVETGDNEAAGRFYSEWGTRFFESGDEPSAAMLDEAAAAASVSEALASVDGADLGAAVEASLAEALELAGPDVGSPVLHIDGVERGGFGPIVSPPPSGAEAGQLWDAIVVLHKMGSVYELKRGRTSPPAFQPT